MKLYLSSLGIPAITAYQSLFKYGAAKQIALIPTAWNKTPHAKSAPFITATTNALHQAGFTTKTIDLAQFNSQPAALHSALAGYDGVWVTGGNTFYLNYWMHQSGFDTILTDSLTSGLVYGGESAGAVVAGKTLHGIELLDNPADAPGVLWEGLGLVDYGIIPHWGKGKYADRLGQARDEMQLFGPVRVLTDDQYIT